MSRIAQLEEYFLMLDFFSCPVQLLIQKKRSHQTMIGAFFTLCCVVSILLYLTNKLTQLDDRLNFQVLYSEVYYENPPYYSLNSDNFTLQFAFQTQNRLNYINESIYYPEAYIVNRKTKDVNGFKIINETKTPIALSKCSKSGVIQEDLADQFDMDNLTNTYCLDWSLQQDFAIYGTDDADSYQFINVSFSQCVNGTKPGLVCADQSTISQVLNRNYIHFQLTSYLINLRDFNEPQTPKVEDIYTTISSLVIKDIEISMQPITTVTDFGYFAQEIRRDTTIMYKEAKEIIDFSTATSLANVIIKLADTEYISYRNYPKVQDVLASAGGLWQILFSVAFFIQKPFSQLSYSMEIINTLFNFEQLRGRRKRANKKKSTKETEGNENKSTVKKSEITLLPQSETKGRDSDQVSQEHPTSNPEGPQNGVNSLTSSKKYIITKRFPNGRSTTFVNTGKPGSTLGDRLKQNEKINEVRQMFTIISSKIKLKFKEYIQYLTYRPKKRKMDQLDYSIQKLDSCLDILFIIEKLQEIDKLKMILLNKAQMSLFEFLPKPTIYLNPYSAKQEEMQYYSSILKPHKTSEQKAQEAQFAFEELLQDFENPITKQLIAGLDQNVVEVLIKEYEDKNRAKMQFIQISNSVINQIKSNQKQRQQVQEEMEKQDLGSGERDIKEDSDEQE